MADSKQFFNDLHDQTLNFILIFDKLKTLKDRMDADAGLAAAAAASATTAGRADLATVDFTNWNASITAFETANVGNVKAFLYKIL